MKEKPILFSGEMIRALLAGTKTQTRRCIKPQPWEEGGRLYWTGENFTYDITPGTDIDRCPYGQPGDRLWVKETFCESDDGVDRPTAFRADEWLECPAVDGKWKPSIFMPRSKSRITLEITEVRVQRLQEISEEDVEAEGVEENLGAPQVECDGQVNHYPDASFVKNYRTLWESINGPGSWAANPYVWAISFKVLAANASQRVTSSAASTGTPATARRSA